MRVFELYSANEFRDFIEGAKRGRPVGHGQSGIVAGDESSSDDQEKCPAGEYDCEAVEAAIIRRIGDGVQNRAPLKIVDASSFY